LPASRAPSPPTWSSRDRSLRSSRRCCPTPPANTTRPGSSAPTTPSPRSPAPWARWSCWSAPHRTGCSPTRVAAALGLLATAGLSASVERGRELEQDPLPPLHRSRGIVRRLSGLFALDSFAGGFVPQTFIAYLFVHKYDASPHTLAITFFAIGILQALSFQAAVRIAWKIGLLRTMVFTHLPSNLLLIGVAFAPNLASAIALLLARFALSQMDVPTRQAYVMGVVDPSERTAAAAYTNTARYLTRPIAPLIAGRAINTYLGAPFLIAGALKTVYDVGLFTIFHKVPLAGGDLAR
jgi:predicted MFS family arabinose efflux permease